MALLRLADALLIVLDAGNDDVLTEAEELLEFMKSNNVIVKNQGDRAFNEKRALCARQRPICPRSREDRASEGNPGRQDGDRACLSSDGEGLEQLKAALFFDLLGKIRVYTRPPGKKVDYTAPFVLPAGTTVLEAAREIHKEIAETLKYARVWGKGVFEGQMVPRDHVLSDGDVVVFYT
jgi:ribosome-interacting GTPase 1